MDDDNHKEMKYMCPECDMSFDTKEEFMKHMKETHGKDMSEEEAEKQKKED